MSILRSSPYRALCVCVSCLLFVCGSLITSNFMCIQLYSTLFNCITGYYWILTIWFWVVHSEAREKLQHSSRRRVLKCQWKTAAENHRKTHNCSPPWPGEEFQASDLEDFVEACGLRGLRWKMAANGLRVCINILNLYST